MAEPSQLLELLRKDPQHRALLAELLLHELVHTPAQSLISAQELVKSAQQALRTLAAHPNAIASLIDELDRRIQATPSQQLGATLGDLLPMTLVAPLQSLLGDAVAPSRTLLAALMDHPGMRQLIEELLTHELAAFGSKIRRLVPEAPSSVPGGRLASKLAGVAKGVASVVGSELEKQMEDRTRDFVSGAIHHSTQRMIDRMASESYAPTLATWRVDVLHALLSLPVSEFQGEWNKIDKSALSQTAVDLLEALVAWEGLESLLEGISEQIWPTIADKSLSDALSPVNAVDTVTEQLSAPLERMLMRVMQGEPFERWLHALHEADSKP